MFMYNTYVIMRPVLANWAISQQGTKGDVAYSRNLKWGIGSLFDSCVNAMGRWSYCPSCMEVSYCTFRFGAIIRPDLRTLSLPCDSPRDNLYACMIWIHAGKATNAYWNYLPGFSYEKIRRYNNSPPYLTEITCQA